MLGMLVGAVLGRLVPVESKQHYWPPILDQIAFEVWEDRDIKPVWRVTLAAAYPPSKFEMTYLVTHRRLPERSSDALHPPHSAAANVAED